MRVVCNTSPLILLAKIQRLDLLIKLYDEIIIPDAILDEIWIKSTCETDQIRALLEERKYDRRKASRESIAELSTDLGHGEREAIAIAMETKGYHLKLEHDCSAKCTSCCGPRPWWYSLAALERWTNYSMP